jgi:hypothetical protein
MEQLNSRKEKKGQTDRLKKKPGDVAEEQSHKTNQIIIIIKIIQKLIMQTSLDTKSIQGASCKLL